MIKAVLMVVKLKLKSLMFFMFFTLAILMSPRVPMGFTVIIKANVFHHPVKA